ncbi:DUF4320 family protein [Caldanaerobacter subterraneus]|uniref:DUF4320 family protein n=1 Tax=Caldanaerobacter subterraneus TaxID=911092 RepID=A0A7Y2PL61_9THEO|nr:DUF4320 family protein [Caldanaerobacter subterraneus]NNG66385.1 DUF4320 family protein [Caldanaerobacter subterraneus]
MHNIPILLILIPLIFFILFFPIGINNFYYTLNVLNNAGDTAIQLMEIKGGIDSEVISAIQNTVQNAGLDPSKVSIIVTPVEANNVSDTSFLERGKIMTLTLQYPGNNLLNYITGLLHFKAMPDQWNYYVVKSGMSQKYR